jgi:hypothetical protein
MSWLFSRVLVEEFLGENSLDGEQSVPLSGKPTPQAYLSHDKTTDTWKRFPSGMMCGHLTETRGEELLKLYRAAFPVRTFPLQEKVTDLTENDQECGEKWRGWLAKYDPNSSLWRTAQCSLLEDLNESLETLPKWGMTANGLLWELPMLARHTKGTESGLWRTPDTGGGGNQKQLSEGKTHRASGHAIQIRLSDQVRNPHLWPIIKTSNIPQGLIKWGTPKAQDSRHALWDRNKGNLGEQVSGLHNGGKLNPLWTEWLMGWPIGWSLLKPLETDKSPSVQLPLGES